MSTGKNGPSTRAPIKYYLLAYNVVSFLGWSAVLLLTVSHILLPHTHSHVAPAKPARNSILSSILSALPIKPLSFAPQSTQQSIPSIFPSWLSPYYHRTKSLHHTVGFLTKFVQTAALFEIAHVALGWVRSPLQTTAMQVGSRLYIVWAIVETFNVTKTSPLYTSLLLAWSQTEVIRYLYYAFSLLPSTLSTSPYLRAPHRLLTYLRYTTFYVLYPLGAASEAGLIYITLPSIGSGARAKKFSGWGAGDWARAALFVIWWPGLYIMYTYMIQQRRRVLGSAFPSAPFPPPKTISDELYENGDGDVGVVEPPATGRKGRKKAKAL